MATYRRVYDLCHLQADCQEPGSAPVSVHWLSSSGTSRQSWWPKEMVRPVKGSLKKTFSQCFLLEEKEAVIIAR